MIVVEKVTMGGGTGLIEGVQGISLLFFSVNEADLGPKAIREGICNYLKKKSLKKAHNTQLK